VRDLELSTRVPMAISVPPNLDIGPPRPEEDDDVDVILSEALHFPVGGIGDWIERLGRKNFVVVRCDGRVVAATALAPMGQWYGGARVPMIGINGVGVAPDQRGTGVGSAMMRAVLEAVRASGAPLTALYPATLRFYQRAGYERAGYRWTYELPIAAIDIKDDTTLDLMPVAEGDYQEIYHAYERRARGAAGNLDRPSWMWKFRLEPKDKRPLRFLAQRDGQTEGYVVYTQGSRFEPLSILDVCVLTPAAGRRLLTLFAGYRSMIERLVWNGGPADPLLYLLRENLIAGMHGKATVKHPHEWMLRIVDVAGALEARGYPAGINLKLHLDVRDDVLPTNNRRFVLEVADGRASVREGGQGNIQLGVRELAMLYTGFMAPVELRAIGAISGTDADLALAGALFGGPRPWIADMF
jgi:predicted acetyltransferase